MAARDTLTLVFGSTSAPWQMSGAGAMVALYRVAALGLGLGSGSVPMFLSSMTAGTETKMAQGTPAIGIALMLGAMSIVPVMDGIAKVLSADYPVLQIVWARYFFHLLLLLPFVLWRYGVRALAVPNAKAQILRGGFLLVSTVLFFAAIARIPLADALALVLVAPLVVTALSPLVLSESVGPRRWAAVCVGFIGALIIVRPGQGVFDSAALLALGAGCVYAFYILATRRLSGGAPPLITLTYTALVGAVVMTALLPWIWVTPSGEAIWLMAAMGAIAAVGHFMLIRAFDHGEASVLATFSYFEIVSTSIVGLVLFGDFPAFWTWVGIVIVTGSGLYISIRERVRGVKPPTAAAPKDL